MNAFLMLLDCMAGTVLLYSTFVAIVHMDRHSCHWLRLVAVVTCVGALGMLLAPFEDEVWRRCAHVAVIAAFTLQSLFGRRPTDGFRSRNP